MSLSKVQVIDLIEIIENGCLHVRTATRIMEDGAMISNTFRRHVVVPGDDYSGEDARVQAICAATHTAGVIAAYKAAQTEQGV